MTGSFQGAIIPHLVGIFAVLHPKDDVLRDESLEANVQALLLKCCWCRDSNLLRTRYKITTKFAMHKKRGVLACEAQETVFIDKSLTTEDLDWRSMHRNIGTDRKDA
jgi:hypothetical protein